MERNTLTASWLIPWLHLGRNSLLTVEQRPASLWIQEGESANFTCSFLSSSFYALHWEMGQMGTDGNRWEPAKGLKNLFVVSINGDEKKRGRVRGTLSTKEGDSSMYIGGSQPEDSATYPCTSTQCSSAPCSPHPNLGLLPLWDQRRGRVIVGRKREIQ
ncbi:hypothetical protein FD754_018469 [Muntiacus muntjak]|uniref:Ig-like domain-containing protein n=1 Tax=Muntiacus muntjak TaxID=9888 RepID=A0A5N3UXH4_MUNMU|nr:hypothetical protein FD754_018469 [Muntiacus muntjak]